MRPTVGIRAVMFDFGGVLTTSPFEEFARFERAQGLPEGLIRRINSTDPDTNAWARLERGDVDLDAFAGLFAAEARALGQQVDGHAVLAQLAGRLRPEMVDAVRRCSARYATACLTNNHAVPGADRPEVDEVLALFDVVLESSKIGVRKPEARFYEMACSAVGVAPDEVVYLDDLGINLKPARAMGMRTIKVVDAATALGELAELVDLGPPAEPGPGGPAGC